MNNDVLRKLGEIKLSLKRISPHPWTYDPECLGVDSSARNVSVCDISSFGKTRIVMDNEGQFIAKSPENIEWLVAQLEQALGVTSDD